MWAPMLHSVPYHLEVGAKGRNDNLEKIVLLKVEHIEGQLSLSLFNSVNETSKPE